MNNPLQRPRSFSSRALSVPALIFAMCLLGVAPALADVLVKYPFGITGWETTAEANAAPKFGYSPSNVLANVIASDVMDTNNQLGIEISSAATVPANAPYLRVDPQAHANSQATAVANGVYFHFVLRPAGGYVLNLTNLSFNVARGGSSTPRGYVVRSSADNFATNLSAADVATARPTYTAVSVPLTGGAFQSLTGITFRVYAFSTGGGASVDFDDFVVSGSVALNGPPAPTGLTAVPTNSQVSLSWNAVAQATNYVVKRSSTSGGPYTAIATNTAVNHLDTWVVNGTTYYYVVAAQGSLGVSGNSGPVSATPLAPPAAPANLSALAGQGYVKLYWDPVATAASYLIQRSVAPGGPYTNLSSTAFTSFTDAGVDNDVSYYYVVAGRNVGGLGPNSAEVNATPTFAPLDLVAIGGTGQVSLDWSDFPDAISYEVKRALVAGGPYTTVATGVMSSEYIDSTVQGGRTYYYVVSAQLQPPYGQSGYSSEASGTTVPSVPGSVTATPLTHTAVVVGWIDTDPVLGGFTVEQADNGIDFFEIAALGPNQRSYVVTGLAALSSYAFRVRASNAIGLSDYSEAAACSMPVFGAKVNFQDTNNPALPAPFVQDNGHVFGDRTNGLAYGWDLDNTSSGRRRGNTAVTNILMDTLTHLQRQYPPRVWEIAVPNGAYRVTLFSGDGNGTGQNPNVDSLYRLDVEGVLMLSGLPTLAAPYISSSNNSVLVTDGRLTLSVNPSTTNSTFSYTDANGVLRSGNIAANNKINFIELLSTDPEAPAVVVQPQTQTNQLEYPVVLSVRTTGTFPQTYQWRKNGVPISGAAASVTTVGAHELTFPNAQYADAGNYDVVISNSVGMVTSVVATVTIVRSFDTVPPVLSAVQPAPGATITTWGQIAITFSEPVAGVEPWDLLVNNSPCQAVSNSGNTWYFSASQPAAGTVNVRFDINHGITDLGGNGFDASTNVWSYQLIDTAPPVVTLVSPAPGATVTRLDTVAVQFNEVVTGVDAADLLINGFAATVVSGSGSGPYVFNFVQPANGVVQLSWAAGHGITDSAATPNAFAGESWSNILVNAQVAGSVIINEFLANNVKTLTNEFGQTEDWIELYNNGTNTVDLLGWALTDQRNNSNLWTFPSVTLAPGQYLVVFADGRDSKLTGGTNKLHTNFKINDQGGYLALFNADLPRVAVSVLAPYPEQRPDYSYGLNTSNAWVYFAVPTPGGPNGNSTLSGITPEPQVSASRGIYDQPFTLLASCAAPTAVLRYTIDGSAPTLANGQTYSGPLTITNTTVLRIAAFTSNSLPSRVSTHSYIFVDQVLRQPNNPAGYPLGATAWSSFPSDYEMDPEIVTNNTTQVKESLLALPTLAISASVDDLFGPVNGIYTHPNPADVQRYLWERAASAELILTNGQTGFQVDCGIRIEGNASRIPQNTPKHPLRLFFRGAYGPGRLDYPIYPESQVTSFDSLVLRADYNNSWVHWDPNQRIRGTRARDAWGKSTLRAMNGFAGHTRYVHLYLNGLYWGVYDFGERIDAEFAASYLGGTAEEYDAIASKPTEAIDGDINAYNTMVNIGRNSNMREPANYAAIQQQLDMPTFLDYIILNFYAGNLDWGFDGNWNAVRRRAPGGKFMYSAWDCEQHIVGTNDNRVSNADVPSGLHTNLVNSPEYRLNFADRVHAYCFNGGALTPEPSVARWDQIIAEVAPGMLAESARWGDYRRDVHQYQTAPYYLYTTNDYFWPEVNRMRTNYFPQRTAIFLNQLRTAGLYPTVSAPVYNQHGGRVGKGFGLTMTASNNIYFTVDGTDPRVAVSGAIAENSMLYTGAVTLTSSTVVKARARFGTNWSALNQATFTVEDFGPLLHVTEIMYNPVGGDAYEFIEMRNDGIAPLEVSGWLFDGITYTFPNGAILAPGQYVILANGVNPPAFATRYPGVSVFGYYSGRLDNAGERIALKKPSGEIIFSIDYSDSGGWSKLADGSGYSLEVIDAFGNPDAASNWRASNNNGTPGAASTNPTLGNVRLSEVLADNVSAVLNGNTHPDYIELFNAGNSVVDLTGWSLSDDSNARKFVFPATNIAAGGYLVVWCDTNAATLPGLRTGFALGRSGETVSLFDASTSRVDVVTFGLQLADRSIARVGGEWVLATPTPNSANTAVTLASQSSLVINEWLADAPPGGSDWIELYNAAAQPVSLQGLLLTQGATLHRLQSLSFVAAGGYVQLFADEQPGVNHLDFKLPASGGTIVLYDASATEVNRVSYGRQSQRIAEGRLPDGSSTITNFTFSPSPGASNYLVNYNGPVLNEIMARNTSGAVNSYGHAADWVELYNPLGTAFDLSGYRLSIDPNNPIAWAFPTGVVLPPNGYVVVWFDQLAPAALTSNSELNTGYKIEGDGGELYLLSPAGLVADTIQFGPQALNLSIGRSANSWTLLASPTLGSANSAAATLGDASVLRINEWLASANTNQDQFVELYNPGAQPVQLSGLYLTDDLSLPGRTKFQIPPLSFIGPAGYADFKADGQPSKGPSHLNFSLNAGSESIRLSGSVNIDTIAYGLQTSGTSQGRLPDGSSNIQSLGCVSPGEANPTVSITTQPVSLAAAEGSNVQLSVAVQANGPVTYQWLFNGSPIANGNNSTLTLNAVQASAAGNYSVVVTRACLSVTSSAAAVRVVEGQVPAANHVRIDSTAGGNFRVRFVGAAGTSYRLERSSDLVTWEPVSTQAAPADGFIEISEPVSPTGNRFYRMVSMP